LSGRARLAAILFTGAALGGVVPDSMAAGAATLESDLASVPRPDLAALAEESREQLLEARARLDEALAVPARAGEVGTLFGRMGELYYLYELLVPSAVCFENAHRLLPDDYRWPYFLGAIASARGEVDEAIAFFSQAAALAPEDAAVHIRLGRLYLDRDELAAAAEHLEKALALDAESAAAHEGLGRVARAQGDYPVALDHFNEALRLQPTASSLHYHLGMIYRDLGDREQARAQLLLNHHHPVVLRDPLVNGLAREGRGPRRYLEAGQKALELGNFETAASAFRQVVARSPEDPRARYNLALALAGLGRLDESIEELHRALELDPEYGDALFNLGSSLAQAGRFEEAAEAFGRLARLDPSDAAAQVQQANALREGGRPDEALRVIGDLLTRLPDHAHALLLSAALLSDRGETAEAERRLERVLRLATGDEDLAEAHMALGDLAHGAGRLAEALDHFERARSLLPRSPRALGGAAFLLGAMGRYAEAAEIFSTLVDLTPGDPNAHFSRAMAFLLGGDCAGAVTALEQGIARLPRALGLVHLLARILATCPDTADRDGSRAVELARAVERQAPSVEHAQTLAMAFAETGAWDQAIELQEQVVRELESQGAGGPASLARSRLADYRNRVPARSPW
jgi:tetratricopeptide (TPR) repeat protein